MSPKIGGTFVTRYTEKGNRYRIWEVPVAAIDPRLLQCTIYLYPSVSAAREGKRVGGSGFLVCFPEERPHAYAVTNAHVHDRGCTVIRMNTADGQIDIVETQPDAWAVATDDDLAVLRLDPSGAFEQTYIPPERFIGENCEIGGWPLWPGDDVQFFGRFIGHDGHQRNRPVVRFGNISMLADPAATVHVNNRDQIAFLVECRSLGGFSGSPAFVGLTQPRIADSRTLEQLAQQSLVPNTLALLGIDCAHLPFWSQARIRPHPDAEKVPDTFVETNSGIAVVIPAWRLMRLLQREDLVRERKQIDRADAANEEMASAAIPDVHAHGTEESHTFTKDDFEQALKKVAKKLPDSEKARTSDE